MDGIIPLMKPKGFTSHDCVQVMRGITKVKKIGHTGTLDPNVEGVLPICIGEATKAIPYLQNLPKVYLAEVTLGRATSTEDADGEVIEEKEVAQAPSLEELQIVLQSFIGEITQIPPMYSAVRVKGKRLYEYAREGIAIERPQRKVTIYNIQLQEVEANRFRMIVTCSKGTYIRTLAVDIGKKLGYPAHMSYLKRIETDSFHIDQAVTFEEIEQAVAAQTTDQLMQPIVQALSHLPVWQVSKELKRAVFHGQKFNRARYQLQIESPFVIMHEDELLAIYEDNERNLQEVKPARIFNMHKNEGEIQ